TDIAKKKRLKGELFGLRAFCHFQVLKSYAESYDPNAMGIPYMETIADDPRTVKPSRLKVSEVFAKIHKDLDSAKFYIPPFVQATNPTNRIWPDLTRLTKKVISAMQARIFLYERKWTDAITAATEVINETPLTPRGDFQKIWSDDALLDTATKTTEVIWKLKKETGNDRIGVFYRPTSSTSNNVLNTTVDYSPSLKLIYAFNRTNDIRYSSYIRILERGYNRTPNLVTKYHPNPNSNGLADIKLFRVAEMYLIRAEAYAENNNLTLANADINKLRSARISNNTNWDITDKDVFIDSLYRERFRELAFEGHRYFDLRRRSKPILREPRAPDDAGGANAIELRPTQRQYYLPIPGFEIRANPNMKQNPNY
ncbi:MAG: RagB/SusD family nutrient uptake outer membrane protein, partial [Sphingobacteriales bacterium]